uniref:Lipid droplet-associated serine hydrolase n=1 Tax=Gopherus agassizii TaxID=38772 RepID=A0A452IPT0_9SAUR
GDSSLSRNPTVPLYEEFIYCCGAATQVLKCGPWKDLLESESKTLPRLLFLIIPGNPGLAGYYRTFIRALYHGLNRRYPVWIVSHAGHCKPPNGTGCTRSTARGPGRHPDTTGTAPDLGTTRGTVLLSANLSTAIPGTGRPPGTALVAGPHPTPGTITTLSTVLRHRIGMVQVDAETHIKRSPLPRGRLVIRRSPMQTLRHMGIRITTRDLISGPFGHLGPTTKPRVICIYHRAPDLLNIGHQRPR